VIRILLRSTSRMESRRAEIPPQWRTPPCSRSQLRPRPLRRGWQVVEVEHPRLIPVSRSRLASAPAKRIRVASLMRPDSAPPGAEFDVVHFCVTPERAALRLSVAARRMVEHSKLVLGDRHRDCADVLLRCATLEVPGIGRMTGRRFSTQVSATCPGDAPYAWAPASTTLLAWRGCQRPTATRWHGHERRHD
jgi:hypothetical protein